MARYIEQFMWGFQSHFRSAVESTVERALEELGQPVEPEVFVIGFARDGREAMPICIEPERGPLSPSHFTGTEGRAAAIHAADPETQLWHSDARLHEQRQAALRDRAWRSVIAETLEAERGRQFYVAVSAPVQSHNVFTAIGLEATTVDAFPALATSSDDSGRVHMSRSLLEAAMNEVLRHVTRTLYEPEAGARLGPLVDPGEVARAAGETVAIDVAYRADSSMPAHGLFDALNKVATAKYEKRPGLGRLILAAPESEYLDAVILLDRPVGMKEIRSVRKLLETSRMDGAALLTNGSVAYGLGHVKPNYDGRSESVFEIVVSGPGTWELRHLDQPLMRVDFGSPRLAEVQVRPERFADVSRRVLSPLGDYDGERLWELAMAAAQAEHGTMLVVSSSARSEAARLEGQALVVQPAKVEASLVGQLTSIDGAVLVDPTGAVVAIGVILDGRATPEGDRSRGARYNSAVRYLTGAPEGTLIILVSEDGTLDLLPRLRPQIRRSDVEGMLDDLRLAAAIEPVDAEAFYKALNRVKRAAFYLSPEQCADVNGLVQEHWERRRREGATIWVTEPPLRPHPDMSGEYLVD